MCLADRGAWVGYLAVVADRMTGDQGRWCDSRKSSQGGEMPVGTSMSGTCDRMSAVSLEKGSCMYNYSVQLRTFSETWRCGALEGDLGNRLASGRFVVVVDGCTEYSSVGNYLSNLFSSPVLLKLLQVE